MFIAAPYQLSLLRSEERHSFGSRFDEVPLFQTEPEGFNRRYKHATPIGVKPAG
jgi:hypothetical protein